MTVEDLRDELDRYVRLGAGHLPMTVEVENHEDAVTGYDEFPVIDLERVNGNASTFMRLVLGEQ